jgi:hypothetical protein
MAKMAFWVLGMGVPLLGELGLAAGDIIIGIKSGITRFYWGPSFGQTPLIAYLETKSPFDIDDDAVLEKLNGMTIDFMLQGIQVISGSVTLEFTVFKEGNSNYEFKKTIKCWGTSMGGWEASSIKLREFNPDDPPFPMTLQMVQKAKGLFQPGEGNNKPCREDTMAC